MGPSCPSRPSCPPRPTIPPNPAADLWRATVAQLRFRLPRTVWEKWLATSKALSLEDDTLLVQVVNDYAAANLHDRWARPIVSTLARVAARPMQVAYQAKPPTP